MMEAVSLIDRSRRIVVNHEFLEYPRAVTIDVAQTFLYFTDWGNSPGVYRTDYNGEGLTIISDQLADMHIKNPNGIFLLDGLDGNTHMYLVDSQFDSGDASVYTNPPALHYIFAASQDGYAYDDFDIPQSLLKTPYGVAAHGDKIFYTDWGLNAIVVVDSNSFGANSEIMKLNQNIDTPGSILYVANIAERVSNRPGDR